MFLGKSLHFGCHFRNNRAFKCPVVRRSIFYHTTSLGQFTTVQFYIRLSERRLSYNTKVPKRGNSFTCTAFDCVQERGLQRQTVLSGHFCCLLRYYPHVHPASLSPPFLNGMGKTVRWKSLWDKMKTGRLLTNYYHKQNKMRWWKTKPPSPQPTFFPDSTSRMHPQLFCLLPSPKRCRETGNEGVVVSP